MLWRRGVALQSSRRGGAPNIGKLLYGKRKNAVHTTSKAKPSVVATLMHVPEAELRRAAQRAVDVKELDTATLSEVLKKCRALNRLDRSEVVVAVADENCVGLTPLHYCILMAHANDNKDWLTALRYWRRACDEKKTNAKVHGALLATYRASSRWQDAVRHYTAMVEDKMAFDPYALHTVMNASRRANAHEVALSVFSLAVRSGASPNSTVYLELLRCMQHSRLPNKWKMSFDILCSLEGKVDLTAGLFNATMATMGGALWTKGVELFQTMKEKNVQPSKETLPTLLSLNPNNLAHTVQCVAEAHTLGMPVTDAMYRAVLTNLLRLKLDHEAVRFAEREYTLCRADPGNPVNSSLALSLAIMDTLLAHSRPQEALLFFSAFESKISNIVDAATRGLGTIGLRSQRWIVQGRVAVLDHNVLLNPRYESLLSHYDSILIPFSSVRLLVRRVRELVGTLKGRYTKNVLRRLQGLVADHNTPVRVLPMAHQLIAHTYIVDGSITGESVELLRKTVREGKGEGVQQQQLLLQKENQAGPLLIRKKNDHLLESEFITGLGGGKEGGTGTRVKTMVLKEGNSSVDNCNESMLNDPDRMSAPERVLAVAVMLKILNPDASVHVVSPNTTQLQVVRRWSQLRPFTPLTEVCYPEEVALKAPAEEQQLSDVGEDDSPKSETPRGHVVQRDARPFFLPS